MPSDRDQPSVDAINAEASVLMKRGIRLMDEGRAETIRGALDCFDRALEMRRHLPIDGAPLLRYGLAACWLNRADALVRLGGSAHLAEAVRSYDEGVAVARVLPLGDDP